MAQPHDALFRFVFGKPVHAASELRAVLPPQLVEHQSSPDPLMPLRMLRYLMRIWERYLEQHPKAKRLPMVVPLVVYQGPRRWTHPVELSELLDIDPKTAGLAAEFLPRFRFLLAWLAAQIGPEAEEVYMSTADMLRAEGRAEHAAEMLLRLLVRKFGAVPDGARERIDAASLEQLEGWTDRVLDAPTADDVFR